jgi:hypothetical protein
MRLTSPFALICVASLALGAVGCIVEEEKIVDHQAGDFIDESSQDDPGLRDQIAYPQGATGFTVGKLMPNLTFWGFADFTKTELQTTEDPSGLMLNQYRFQKIQAADFFNPDGNGTYAADSPYVKTQSQIEETKTQFEDLTGLYSGFDPTAMPKAVAFLVSSVWCPPCNAEAKDVLPHKYAEMRAKGGHIMSILFDSKDQGIPATLDFDLVNWSNAYKPTYTMVIDPSRSIDPIAPPFYPGGIIVDPRTMTVMHIGSLTGSNEATFWGIFEQVIAGTYVPPAG